MSFTDLLLAAPLLRALSEEGYTAPTPIQSKSIPHALEGRDLLGCAQTGTGKTAAFALPILHRLLAATPNTGNRNGAQPRRTPRALILSPTRELAGQIGDSFAAYGRHTALRHAVVYGGVSQHHQVRALERGVDVLVATPGRLMDLMQQRLVDLRSVEVFVLDEADRMLDMGFIDPVRRIGAAVPANRQTLLFSATMPREVAALADSLLRNPVKVAAQPIASAAPLIEQSVHHVPRASKSALLESLLRSDSIERALVFTKTKHGADKLSTKLTRSGVPAEAIHGNKAQNRRLRVLADFRSGRVRVLVATDLAARGLDVDGITHVFNFDLPHEPEAYVHRIGRTGRAGATGIAVAFCDPEERGLLRSIERLTGSTVPVAALPEGFEHAAAAIEKAAPEARNGAKGSTKDRKGANAGSRRRTASANGTSSARSWSSSGKGSGRGGRRGGGRRSTGRAVR
ncbi:MAG: DEAD/DEAH box helicase [Phycisphaerales bacterium]|nr:DEAD/DEAH box helicase [Phycisphaerales bacterium]